MIGAYIFGGTSSARCSNYALRRTAGDNESMFGKASETPQKFFYLVDLLKFLENVKSAKHLVKGVMKICKAGEYYVAKFI